MWILESVVDNAHHLVYYEHSDAGCITIHHFPKKKKAKIINNK